MLCRRRRFSFRSLISSAVVGAGREVTNAVRDFRPHAVLLDLGMPDRNGYEVAKELTREYGTERPVLVAVTGRGSDSDRREALNQKH